MSKPNIACMCTHLMNNVINLVLVAAIGNVLE